jgi:cytochrome c oxidase cbb3-type subunit 4
MMNLESIFELASRATTVASFITFVGILWWTYVHHKRADFDAAARAPFADEDANDNTERRHV